MEAQDESKNLGRAPSRVLVVEDDTTFEPVWAHIIDRADKVATFEWATSVTEAEEILERAFRNGNPFDLVVSDIFLSGTKTGIDLWRAYHQRLREGVLLISSIDPLKISKYFQGEGHPRYLQKPLNIEETIETVFELLHH